MAKVVIVICEFSGVVRDAFAAVGWDAWSCDLLPSERSGKHLQMDCRDLDYSGVDLVIAHPPCTYLSNSGVCHLYTEEGRWEKMVDAALFFRWCLELPVPRKAIENPIQHKYARAIIGQEYTHIIQPYQFGHLEQKATCLWLDNLPELEETENVKEVMMCLPDNQRQRLHYLPPSPNRQLERSRTFEGVAQAMAEQWGKL